MNPVAFTTRQKNERRILEYVINNTEASRVTLAKALDLSTATVTNIVTDLLEKNLLFEGRQEKSTVGRRTTLLQFNGDLFYVLTVEIPVDRPLQISVCDLFGNTIISEAVACEVVVTSACPNTQVLKNLIYAISDFLKQQPSEIREKVKLVGLCPHGMVNAQGTLDIPGLNWTKLNLAMPLQATLGMPVYAEGITRILAHYELRFIDPSEKNVIFLNLSCGVGMVQFFDRKMVAGKTGVAGEVGHISLNTHGPQCYCGNQGCFERYCGMASVLQQARALLTEESKHDLFYDMVINQKLPLTQDLLFRAQKEGSLVIHELLSNVSEYLGMGFAMLYNIFDPDRIIVSMDSYFERNFLIENAKMEARSRIVNQFCRDILISGAHLSGSQVHRAISAFALKKYLDSLYHS